MSEKNEILIPLRPPWLRACYGQSFRVLTMQKKGVVKRNLLQFTLRPTTDFADIHTCNMQ